AADAAGAGRAGQPAALRRGDADAAVPDAGTRAPAAWRGTAVGARDRRRAAAARQRAVGAVRAFPLDGVAAAAVAGDDPRGGVAGVARAVGDARAGAVARRGRGGGGALGGRLRLLALLGGVGLLPDRHGGMLGAGRVAGIGGVAARGTWSDG